MIRIATHRKLILEHMYINGSINSVEAMSKYGIPSLHKVIKELKKKGYLFSHTCCREGISEFIFRGIV